jgi:aromatic ring-opening dioxygenase catalytic subunit (LigB family)
LLPKEPRGQDGRGFEGTGLDHGVFVPFRIMFGEEFTDIPIVQVSIDGSLDPEKNWQVGKAVAKLRYATSVIGFLGINSLTACLQRGRSVGAVWRLNCA